MLASTSALGHDGPSNHALDQFLGLCDLGWIRSVIKDVLVEVAVTNMALDGGCETDLVGVSLAGLHDFCEPT